MNERRSAYPLGTRSFICIGFHIEAHFVLQMPSAGAKGLHTVRTNRQCRIDQNTIVLNVSSWDNYHLRKSSIPQPQARAATKKHSTQRGRRQRRTTARTITNTYRITLRQLTQQRKHLALFIGKHPHSTWYAAISPKVPEFSYGA